MMIKTPLYRSLVVRLGNALLAAGLWVAVLLAAGCKRSAEIETSSLENAFAATPPASAQSAPPANPEVRTAAGGGPDLKRLSQEAVSAIKNSNYVGAFISLQTLQSSPSLTAEQLTTVQDTMATFQLRLAEKADRGDPAAKQAMQALQSMRRR